MCLPARARRPPAGHALAAGDSLRRRCLGRTRAALAPGLRARPPPAGDRRCAVRPDRNRDPFPARCGRPLGPGLPRPGSCVRRIGSAGDAGPLAGAELALALWQWSRPGLGALRPVRAHAATYPPYAGVHGLGGRRRAAQPFRFPGPALAGPRGRTRAWRSPAQCRSPGAGRRRRTAAPSPGRLSGHPHSSRPVLQREPPRRTGRRRRADPGAAAGCRRPAAPLQQCPARHRQQFLGA